MKHASETPTSVAPDSSPFHEGERAVQERAGVRDRIQTFERRLFRDSMPDQHRALFAKLSYLIVGSLDGARRPWASIVVGRPGFVDSPDPRTLRVSARPGHGDPLAQNLAPGAPIALLGIELQTRRRNRLNGTLSQVDGDGFDVLAKQSFGNCPKYIQTREPTFIAEPSSMAAPRPTHVLGPVLPERAASLIQSADTFFIASASARSALSGAADGLDVSHRGGKPGFVRVSREGGPATALTWPDFFGNNFFNTLGNLAVNPRAGLLFVDFASGDVLSLTGQATIVWAGTELAAFDGAERLLRFTTEDGFLIERAVPLRWSTAREAPELKTTEEWR